MKIKQEVLDKVEQNIGIKLHVGCGYHKFDGWTRLDVLEEVDPDIQCDLDKEGIPLPDNCVTEVHADYILEHVDNVLALMQEIWRVCVSGSKVYIGVPYFGWAGAHKDPTHKHYFDPESYRYWNSKDTSVPHYGYNMVFTMLELQMNVDNDINQIPEEQREFAMKHFINMITKLNFFLQVEKEVKL